MKVYKTIYKTTDDSGAYSIHECGNMEQAKQLHLLHYGLFSVNFKQISELKFSDEICKEKECENFLDEMRLERFGNL